MGEAEEPRLSAPGSVPYCGHLHPNRGFLKLEPPIPRGAPHTLYLCPICSPDGIWTLGKDRSCGYQCMEVPTLSRRHTQIRMTPDGRYAVRDAGSTNGTFLGQTALHRVAAEMPSADPNAKKKIPIGDQWAPIKTGDCIVMGSGKESVSMVFQATCGHRAGKALLRSHEDNPPTVPPIIELCPKCNLTLGWSFGRSSKSSHIHIVSGSISRLQCMLVYGLWDDDGWRIQDKQSQFGTFIGDRPVSDTQFTKLASGQILTLGRHIKYKLEFLPAPPPDPAEVARLKAREEHRRDCEEKARRDKAEKGQHG